MVWEVRAVCDDSGACFVLEFLESGDATTEAHRKWLLNQLREYIPQQGPPRNALLTKPLGDGLFELRKQPRKGPKLRVLFFHDRDRVVVCTHGFLKGQAQTPIEEIDRARALQAEYFASFARGDLQVRDLPTIEKRAP